MHIRHTRGCLRERRGESGVDGVRARVFRQLAYTGPVLCVRPRGAIPRALYIGLLEGGWSSEVLAACAALMAAAWTSAAACSCARGPFAPRLGLEGSTNGRLPRGPWLTGVELPAAGAAAARPMRPSTRPSEVAVPLSAAATSTTGRGGTAGRVIGSTSMRGVPPGSDAIWLAIWRPSVP
jgi:hypothetical protein